MSGLIWYKISMDLTTGKIVNTQVHNNKYAMEKSKSVHYTENSAFVFDHNKQNGADRLAFLIKHMEKKELRKQGDRFFIKKLDGMERPSIGYCSHYPPYEVFVCGLVDSSIQDEKIQVEVIGLIGVL